ncbi:11489_t:CDS:2 [Funneliformis caledonium]|uniref:11489_t:CDS:1 n=1 Tax=Funneliformis caledonium TaxID=1117310 RepID=A0A9N9CIX9_9GLOM|nr:11489_t:CDS:2 [Funneliformis caledonium]
MCRKKVCDKDASTLNDKLEIDKEILNDKEEINIKRVKSKSSDDDDKILLEYLKVK